MVYRCTQRHSRRGAALLIALSVLVVMGMLAAAFVKFMDIAEDTAEFEFDTLRARYIARGGIEAARAAVSAAGGSAIDDFSNKLGDGSYAVTLKQADNGYEADVTGTVKRDDGLEVTARIVARMKPTAGGVRIAMWQE